MADSPSIDAVSFSPRLTSRLSIREEGKTRQAQESSVDTAVSPNTFQKCVAELVGTYILAFAVCGAALVDREKGLTIVGIAMVSGLAVMVVIYTLGHISGAHVNPAVTIAFASARRFPLTQVPVYVLAQLVGATLACLTLRGLFHDQDDIRPMVTQYSSSTTDLEAIAWEFVITFILMFTICGVASDHRANKELCGVAIGATVLFNALVAGPITGASMNPARSIGAAVVSGIYKNLWVYVVASILGAMAAALTYSLLRMPKADKSKDKKSTQTIHNDLFAEP